MNRPSISVLMAVHNGEPHLRACLESVLSQSFHDFEFVVVNDASTDGTEAILESVAGTDPRIKVLRNNENLGLTRSLNRGLAEAEGTYIARIDADDLCRPDRLQIQRDALERDPELVIVGSGYQIIDGDGIPSGKVSIALSDNRIRWLLGLSPPSFHPSFFFRRIGPDGAPVLYDESFATAQDYDLWSRLSRIGRTAVLPDVLIDYRRHAGGISVRRAGRQIEDARRITMRNLSDRLPADVLADVMPLVEMRARRVQARGSAIPAAINAMRRLLAFDRDLFEASSDRRWMRRTAAGLLAETVLVRGGAIGRPNDAIRFLYHAIDFLPALALAIAKQPATARKAFSTSRKR